MQFYRCEIHGRLIEIRRGDFGGETVLVDGRPVSRRPFAGVIGVAGGSHFFEIEGQDGATHHVEVRLEDAMSISLRALKRELFSGNVFVVSVDGRERCRLMPMKRGDEPTLCPNCGYDLRNLPVENEEVRCPECGRHTPARMING